MRNLFDTMVGATGTGISVTDEAVRRFVGTVPADLSSSEASTIIRQLHSVASETLEEALQRLASSVQSIRSHRTPDPSPSRRGAGDNTDVNAGASVAFDPETSRDQ